MNQLPTEQHEKFRWFNEDNINTIDNAHPSSIEYFKYTSGNDVQYRIVATRRGIYDTLLWQTPVLSLTAQAFLFSISLGSDASQWERRTAAVLALIASIASIQLTSRHRFHEIEDSKWLNEFETKRRWKGYNVIHQRRTIKDCENRKRHNDTLIHWIQKFHSWIQSHRSYPLWIAMLATFAILATIIIAQPRWFE